MTFKTDKPILRGMLRREWAELLFYGTDFRKPVNDILNILCGLLRIIRNPVKRTEKTVSIMQVRSRQRYMCP